MSITSSNAIVTLSLVPVFTVPQRIQRFSADDVFGTDPVTVTETSMGVDGNLSGGLVYNEVGWNVSLMADSPSNDFFDQWNAAQKVQGDVYKANGVIILTAIGSKWNMINGFLKTYPPIPDAGKTLKFRKFMLVWESVQKVPA